MKKPQCKDTCVKTVCQAFYRQYMLSLEELCNKKCYKGQNFTQWYQILLKLTFRFLFLKEKDALSGAYNARTVNPHRQSSRKMYLKIFHRLFLHILAIRSKNRHIIASGLQI